MTLDASTLARIHIAMREGKEIEIRQNGVTIQTGRASGPWGVPMLVGYSVDYGLYTVRQWCRSVEELVERLEDL